MTLEIGFLLAVLAVMVVLFLTETLPVELTAFAGLAVLILTGYVQVEEAFDGFASPAVITMLSVFFVSAALLHTGVADMVGARIHALVGDREVPLVLVVMFVAGVLSAFMNNVAACAVLMPAIAALARTSGIPPSRLFMPLAFGSILGGTTTLVGTPPNILTAQVMQEQGIEPFQLFDFTPFGLVLLGLGMVFMATVGRWLLPVRDPEGGSGGADLPRLYRVKERLFAIRVPAGSQLDGQSLREARLGTALQVKVVAVVRDDGETLAPAPDFEVQGGDELLVEGEYEDLQRLLRVRGLKMAPSPSVPVREAARVFTGIILRVGEASAVVGKTVQQLRFRERYGGLVASIWRDGGRAYDRPGGLPLREGDEILAIGDRHQVEDLAAHPDFDLVAIGPQAMERLEDSVFQVEVTPDSPLAGITVQDSRMGELVGLTVVGIIPPGEQLEAARPQRVLEEGDQLLVTGEPERVASLLEVGDVDVEQEPSEARLESEDVRVVEAVIAPRSDLEGRTLRELDFRERYGLQVLAVWRQGEPQHEGLADLQLQIGDALLLQGPTQKLTLLVGDPDFVVLSDLPREVRRTSRAPFALGALGLLIVMVAGGYYPIQVAAFVAAVAVVLSGALTMEEAYRAIEWRAIFLVAAILPVGGAMERSGAAMMLADLVVDLAGDLGPHAVLFALLVLSSLLSQGLDGAPTVVLLAPVVFLAADQLGISPRPLVMAVGLAASAAFMTPFSHKANLLVMGAGGYRVADFIKTGSILTVVVLAVLGLMIPMIIPF